MKAWARLPVSRKARVPSERLTVRIGEGRPRLPGTAILTWVRSESRPGHSVPSGHSQASRTRTPRFVARGSETVTATGIAMSLQPSRRSFPGPVLSA